LLQQQQQQQQQRQEHVLQTNLPMLDS